MRKCTVTLEGMGQNLPKFFFHYSNGLGSLLYLSAREGCSLDVAAATLVFQSLFGA